MAKVLSRIDIPSEGFDIGPKPARRTRMRRLR